MSGMPKHLKVILIGDSYTGKSSLMKRFERNSFDADFRATVGVDFRQKDVTVDGEIYTMQIWDTAGHERYKSLTRAFYKGADCCLLTFAVDDVRSFRSLSMWKREFLYYADITHGKTFPFVVIGNKVDVPNREVNDKMVRDWCNEHDNCPYYETSAKHAINVNSAFEAAVKRFKELQEVIGEKCQRRNTVELSKKTKKKACCG